MGRAGWSVGKILHGVGWKVELEEEDSGDGGG